MMMRWGEQAFARGLDGRTVPSAFPFALTGFNSVTDVQVTTSLRVFELRGSSTVRPYGAPLCRRER